MEVLKLLHNYVNMFAYERKKQELRDLVTFMKVKNQINEIKNYFNNWMNGQEEPNYNFIEENQG